MLKACGYRIYILLSISLLLLCNQSSRAQCGVSDITATYSSKCLPSLARFIISPAFQKGSIYYWDFGNGQIIGSDTSYFQYSTSGDFGITVTITEPDGSKCTIAKAPGFIHFNPPLNPGFFADQTKLCSSPSVITLHDTTENVVTRDWYLNNSISSNHSANVSITDSATGFASITLIVYDNLGCIQNLTRQDYINVPEHIPVNFCSVMTENNTHDQISSKYKIGFDTIGYNISEFNWSFPGGSPSFFIGYTPPSITYSNLSTFNNVSLTVKTVGGCIADYTKTYLVGKYYSVSASTICQKDSVVINYLLGHDDNRSTNGFVYIQSNLSFYELNYPGEMVKFYESGLASFKFPILYRNSSCWDTLVVPNMVNVLPPLAGFQVNPACSVPGKIKLHALYSDPASGINQYKWQIFDSTSATQVPGSPIGPISSPDTSILINQQGYYSIRLIVSNNSGCTDTILKTNIVSVGTPDINYQIKKDTICVGDTLYINNLTKWHSMPGNPIRYGWTFYNEDIPNVEVGSNDRSPRIVFTNPGRYELYYQIGAGYNVGSGQGCRSLQDKFGAVFVNGISGRINPLGIETCPPVTYKLSAQITGNEPKNSPLKYTWAISPPGEATLTNSTDSVASVVFKNQDCYVAMLTVSNGTCTSAIPNDSFICIGTTALFNISSTSCRNTPVRTLNMSSKKANVFKWTSLPSIGVTINNDTARNPIIKFSNPGCYRILLQTSDSLVPNCFDTISKSICIYAPPILKTFYSPDSSSHCAPRIDSFYVKSIRGKKFYWDFGDGITFISNDSVASHPYLTNSNKGFTVKAVAIDSNGCPSDTFTINNYIKISGPEPSFVVSSKPPCDSGTVNFINNSKFIYNYYFIYGDNSGADSNRITPHFYKYVDYSRDSNTYMPTLFAYDETGCLAFASSIVKLYRPPVLKIGAKDTLGCVPLGVQFYDSTQYALKYLWQFGDGISDTGFAPFHIYRKSSPFGNPYKVTLTATTDKGCADTSKPINISVYPLSVPSFQVFAPDPLCYNDSVRFKASTSGALPARYKWKFGDGNLISDTSSLQNPVYHYTFSGKHIVSLKVFTNLGCADSIFDSTSIRSLDSFPPVAPIIDYVTVTSSNQVQIVFSRIFSSKFKSYVIYRYPGPDSIYSITTASDTVYFDNPPGVNVDSQSYTYSLRSTDECGFISPFSLSQHSILLMVNKYKLNALQLIWNKYSGWDSVIDYQIYKKNSTGKFVLMATVGANDSTYLDSNLCPGLYSYYVRAVDKNGEYYSISDTASNKPDFLYQSNPIVLRKATVVNDNSVFVNWDPTVQLNFKSYLIDRYSIPEGWLLNYANTAGLSFDDNGVDVSKYSYIYRVNVLDECGDISPSSNIGNSILLTGTVVNDSRLLMWNSYKQWANGVSSYHLQLMQNDGSFNDIAVLPSTDTSYLDALPHSNLTVQTCYRVYAIENMGANNQFDTSLSNVACPNLPARIFIPTAFSPNSDSVNDVFIPEGLSVIINPELPGQKYDFKIYNRWGELVFETNDFMKGWDGKYKGVIVQPGVYIYSVYAQGYDGHRFYLTGDVTVLR